MSGAMEQAYEHILRDIQQGKYLAGTRLREEALSQAIGVSRTPVREALRRLTAEGIVESLPKRGAHVASWSHTDLNEIFHLRALVESYAAQRAAEAMAEEDIERLEELAARMEEEHARAGADWPEKVSGYNNEFHRVLIQGADSPLLLSITNKLVQLPLIHRTYRLYTNESLKRSFSHHREIIAAVRERDGQWARSVMEAHILAARRIFVERPDN